VGVGLSSGKASKGREILIVTEIVSEPSTKADALPRPIAKPTDAAAIQQKPSECYLATEPVAPVAKARHRVSNWAFATV
jgi:hypothetical protein